MKRSDKEFPLMKLLPLTEMLRKAWVDGWLDEFSDDHMLIKAIEGRLGKFQGLAQFNANNTPVSLFTDNFQENFCINFSVKVACLAVLLGENKLRVFFRNQLSAGKSLYDEAQFFRALSEVSILSFWGMQAVTGEYEPRLNGKRNPEARLNCRNGVTVDVEVKTPGFHDLDDFGEMALPTVLLDEAGRKLFQEYCKKNNIRAVLPRVNKLKDFLNSAASKFENVDHVQHMNLLYINWTFSEVVEFGFEEALSLLAYPVNGLLVNKEIGLHLGVREEVYEKVTAVIVYTESLSGLMFSDFRWVWNRNSNGMPHFGIVGLHNLEGLFATTRMNPFADQLTPALKCFTKDAEKHTPQLLNIIGNHLLR